jgi:fucose permease
VMAVVMAVVIVAAKDMFAQPTASNPIDNLSDSNGGGGHLAAAVGGTVVPIVVPVVTPVRLQAPLLMVTVPALLVLVVVMVTVPAALQLPSRTGCSLPMGASVLATRRTLLLVQCRRCRPPHRERLCPT